MGHNSVTKWRTKELQALGDALKAIKITTTTDLNKAMSVATTAPGQPIYIGPHYEPGETYHSDILWRIHGLRDIETRPGSGRNADIRVGEKRHFLPTLWSLPAKLPDPTKK